MTVQAALRPRHDFPTELDDVVVKCVETFRAEKMDDGVWWMACYFANGERITFHITIDAKPKRIVISAGEMPEDWVDIDA